MGSPGDHRRGDDTLVPIDNQWAGVRVRGVNDGQPRAWGALKAMRALAAISLRRRTALVRRSVDIGDEFLFSRDPHVADYPMPGDESQPSLPWFKLGFPSGYSSDVLQVLEVLAELGHGRDVRPKARPLLVADPAGSPGAG